MAKCRKLYRQSPKVKASAKAYRESPKGKYVAHKSRAKRRGVEWLFTFETWWALWEPHFARMGRGADQLCMCRYGDEGPYSPENCRIDTKGQNSIEAAVTKKRKRTHCGNGHPFTPENTRSTPGHPRVCRICAAEADRRYRARKRTALSEGE